MIAPAVHVHVAPVTAAMSVAVDALQVRPDQVAYVGVPAFNLASARADPLSEAMAVLADDQVIGFYRLDFAPNAIIGRDLGAPTVGLRAFLIDSRHQRHGYGARATAALCADIEQRYPERRLLILLVHCRNQAGLATYRRSGFINTGSLLAGGRAGPQYLMLRALGATAAGRVGQ